MRHAAWLLLFSFLIPAEAGLFRRRPTPAQQAERQRKSSRASYGSEAYRKEIGKGRKRKAKLPPFVTRPKVTPY